MSKMNNQVIYNMQSEDRAYGEVVNKQNVQKDKTHKNPNQFNRMSVKDLLNMQENGDYEYEDGYEKE